MELSPESVQCLLSREFLILHGALEVSFAPYRQDPLHRPHPPRTAKGLIWLQSGKATDRIRKQYLVQQDTKSRDRLMEDKILCLVKNNRINYQGPIKG